jgi:hypothetical protein
VTWTVPAAAPVSSLAISPATGSLVTVQAFDLALVAGLGGRTVVGGHALLDGSDVTGPLVACFQVTPLLGGGIAALCPGLTGGLLGPGSHTFTVALDLDDGTTLGAISAWEVLDVTEP